MLQPISFCCKKNEADDKKDFINSILVAKWVTSQLSITKQLIHHNNKSALCAILELLFWKLLLFSLFYSSFMQKSTGQLHLEQIDSAHNLYRSIL